MEEEKQLKNTYQLREKRNVKIFGELFGTAYNQRFEGRAENKTIMIDFLELKKQLENQDIKIIKLENNK